MGLVVYGVGFILGMVMFGFLNNVFDIYYFGFKGIASMFMGCWFTGVIIVVFFGVISKWLIIILGILWMLSKVSKSGSK